MAIYSLSYKNLRRNWWRNTSTVLRIAFGVIVLLILISSGIGITTVLGQTTGSSGNETSNLTDSGNMGFNNFINSLNDYVNSLLGSNTSNSQLIKGVRSILGSIISFLDIIASIVFLVGIFGITYAMDLNLLERRREIGLLKSLGFTELQIMFSLLLEAGLLGFIGAMIGTVLVVIGITILSSVINIALFSIVMPVWLPFWAIFITTILSALIAAFSIWYYVKKDPVEALRI
ncbi:MAG: FtsX-like permease family protein [Methanobacterium sp.]|uniref:ABC transporter permease n=1 Tax=Methanobacterium sp. TaxID=2164 RepID=UPI003D656E95|nr:FtsX-like permease family protein [Methanobacterium sp.]